MDGNNRWAKKNDLSQYNAYKKGGEKLIQLTNYLFRKYKVQNISAFALSSDNLKRSKSAISEIKKVLNNFLDNYSNNDDYFFQIKILGEFNFLDKKTRDKILLLNNRYNNSKFKLYIFLNYSGKNDILNSLNVLNNSKKKLTKKNFENYLITKKIPNPEILIRPGGFKRLSNFLLYEIAYTELFFTNTLWPDLNIKFIDNVISKYNKIERKFGA